MMSARHDADEDIGGRRCEELNPRVVVVRKLHKKTSKDELAAFAAPFGGVTSINMWYGFGKGIIEMESEAAAAAIFAAYREVAARVRGKEVTLSSGVAARADQLYKQSPSNPSYVQKEIMRCVADVCKLVESKAVRQAACQLRGACLFIPVPCFCTCVPLPSSLPSAGCAE